MALPTKRYHQIMMKMFEITENGERFVTIRDIIEAIPHYNSLNNEKYKGTKQLSFALRWLEKQGLLKVDRNGNLHKYSPSVRRHEYLESLMKELNLEFLLH